jgi:hypothetical protein
VLLAWFAASLVLAGQAPIYALTLMGLCGLCLLGGYGAWLELRVQRRLATRLAVSRHRRSASSTEPASQGILNA